MSIKGSITKSDYIEFDRALAVGNKLMSDSKSRILGFYIIVSINSGLRVGDVLKLKWEDFRNDDLHVTEQKTRKPRSIRINDHIKKALIRFDQNQRGLIFLSQKGSVFSIQQLNLLLKKAFPLESRKYNISSHSLRKSFGRRVYENNFESEKSLVYLAELFNHTSASVTRQYLGIRKEELDNIYESL